MNIERVLGNMCLLLSQSQDTKLFSFLIVLIIKYLYKLNRNLKLLQLNS